MVFENLGRCIAWRQACHGGDAHLQRLRWPVHARNAEVADAGHSTALINVGIEENVFGFDVAMNDLLALQVSDADQHLTKQTGQVHFSLCISLGFEIGAQIAASTPMRLQVDLLLLHIINDPLERQDVGVLQIESDPGLQPDLHESKSSQLLVCYLVSQRFPIVHPKGFECLEVGLRRRMKKHHFDTRSDLHTDVIGEAGWP